MHKTLAGLLLTAAGGLIPSSAWAVSPFDCPAVPGMVIGQTAGVCYFVTVNPDGSINTTPTGGTGAGTATDFGGTITAGGTAQTAIAANTSRKNALCQNPTSALEDLFLSITSTVPSASGNNYASLSPGGTATIIGTSAVKVIAATTGHRFYCTEWQ